MNAQQEKIYNFNPRSHEGSDRLKNFMKGSKIYFNPRSHEGSDMMEEYTHLSILHFNPRSHEGSDSENRQQIIHFRSKHKHNIQNIRFCQLTQSLLQILMHGNTSISCANPARF